MVDFANSQILDEDEEAYTVRIPKNFREPAQSLVTAPEEALPQSQPGQFQEMPEGMQVPDLGVQVPQQEVAQESIPMQRPATLPIELEPINIQGQFTRPQEKAVGVPVKSLVEQRNIPQYPDPSAVAKTQVSRGAGAYDEYSKAVAREGMDQAKTEQVKADILDSKVLALQNLSKKNAQAYNDLENSLFQAQNNPSREIAKSPSEKKASLGSRIIMGIAAFLGGFGKGPNQVLRMIDNELERKQRREIAQAKTSGAGKKSRSSYWMKILGNREDAIKMAKADRLAEIDAIVEAQTQRTKSPEVANKARVLLAENGIKREKLFREVVDNQYRNAKQVETEAIKRGLPGRLTGKIVDNKDIITKDDKDQSIPIPGIDKSYVASSPEGGKIIKEALVDLKPMYASLNTIKKFREKHKGLWGKAKIAGKRTPFARLAFQEELAIVDTAAQAVIMHALKIHNLGVLNPHDLVELKKLYAVDAKSIFSYEDGKLEENFRQLENSLRSKFSTYGVVFDERLLKERPEKIIKNRSSRKRRK